MKINSAVIGSGIGQKHIEAIDNYKNFYVSTILEKNKSKIKKLKKKYKNKKITSNENEVFMDNSVKLVSIASFDKDHFNQIMKCIHNKKNFIVEKPICSTPSQLKKIDNMIKKKNINLFSNLVLRVNSIFNNIKNIVDNKKVFYIEADYIWGRKNKLFGWRSKDKNYSLTLGGAIHVIDLIMWILNSRPLSVYTVGNNKVTKNTKFKKDNLMIYIFEFPRNVLVKITVNSAGIHEHFHKLIIYEQDKTIDHSINGSFLYKNYKDGKLKKTKIKGFYPDKKNRKKLIRNYLDHLINNKNKLILKNKEQIDLMRVCFFADKSLKEKKKIKINYT